MASPMKLTPRQQRVVDCLRAGCTLEDLGEAEVRAVLHGESARGGCERVHHMTFVGLWMRGIIAERPGQLRRARPLLYDLTARHVEE